MKQLIEDSQLILMEAAIVEQLRRSDNIKLHQKVEFKLRDIFNKHVIDKTKAFMEFQAKHVSIDSDQSDKTHNKPSSRSMDRRPSLMQFE